ncbi:nitrite reductase (NO-forming) [Georgenia satyanarayanai]|uniref:Copper-containing nitrite reductase n=1 Tax=Georgenia satyanarayanai TaxID=860221 RepID=A0A2Y9AFE2_9MICO|nr:multicopper oxidase domain-containing protein [Georgenia satyanarayanai]PYF99372.1 nitrite reductase (NO-forming) [Georgenia satyanarayanai]SSA43184.1 nitrite reductase (NO-forming) [Georgenia satyanarayanai]
MNLGRPTRPPMARRPWHVTVNALVVAWFLAAFVVAVAHRWIPEANYLMVHLTLLGAVTTAILIWSAHFADTLLGRPAPGGQGLIFLRLGVHTVSAICVIVGIATDRWPLVVVGGVGITLVALAHVVVILLQRRGALMARFGALSLFYVCAGLCLAVGVWLGVMLARTTPSAEVEGRLYTAHTTTMLLGWVGLTVLGTLVVLWPTMLRTKMVPGAPLAARRAMVVLVAGLAVIWVAAATGQRLLVVPAVAVYLTGIVLIVRPMVAIARDKPPRSYATLSATTAVVWLVGCLLTLAVLAATAPDWAALRESLGVLAAPYAAGFAGQVLLGALSYLAPVMLGGGPRVVRRVDEEMNRAAGARIVVVNLSLLLFVLPLPSLVRVTTSLLGLAGLASFLVLLGRALWARRQADRESSGAVIAASISTGPPPVPRRLGALYGVGAVALAVVLGVAGDPAAAGLTGSSADDGAAATGRTTTVRVEARDMRFVPDVVEVPAGDRLVVELVNTDDDVHDLVLDNGVRSGRMSAGETVELDLGVVGRDVEGWCSVAGHRQMGMTLDVVAVGAAPAAAADHGDHASSSSAADPAHEQPDLRAEPDEDFTAHPAELPPAPAGKLHQVTLTVGEVTAEVAPGVEQERWTFNGTDPGPTLRGTVGDVFEITLVNDGTIGHSIDFHAGALAPDEPMRTIAPGESLVYRFTAERAGIWMYHCSTASMSMHIAQGMVGAVVIDPPGLEPVDREYVLVQSEVYLGEAGGTADADAIASEQPDLVVFNGYANQYDHEPLIARVGERVRVWVLAAGPNRGSAFHVVGGQFDTVWSEGAYRLGGPEGIGGASGGAQVLPLVPAQGGFVELELPEAGHYPVVSHAMVDAERGAHGIIRVTE